MNPSRCTLCIVVDFIIFGGKMKLEQLCNVISYQIKTDKKIESTDRLSSDIGICSFDMMVIIVEIEKICGHEIDTTLIKNDMTISELLNLINT